MSISPRFGRDYTHVRGLFLDERDNGRLDIGPYVGPKQKEQMDAALGPTDAPDPAPGEGPNAALAQVALGHLANIRRGLATGAWVSVRCEDQSRLATAIVAAVKLYGDYMPEPLACFDSGVALSEYPGGPPFWLLAIQ